MTDACTLDPDADPGLARVAELIRSVPDFPEPGILFRDITPVLADREAFAAVATELAALVGEADLVAGIEARGFLLGAAAAVVAGIGISCRCARPASCRWSPRRTPTSSSTARRRWSCPRARSRPGHACSSWTTCWPPVVPRRRRAGCSARWAPAWSASLGLIALGGRDRLGPIPVHLLLHA
jgi:adenine phosphoribosyltransferase